MKKNRSWAILGAALCAGLLSACAPSSGGKGTRAAGPIGVKPNSDAAGTKNSGNVDVPQSPYDDKEEQQQSGESETITPPGNISGSGFDRANGGIYLIKGLASEKCLTVENGSTTNNAPLVLFTCDANDADASQKFQIVPRENGYFQIMNMNSSKVVELRNQQTARGTIVQQNDALGSDTQLFQIIEDRNGAFHIRVKGASAYIDVEGRDEDDGATIHVWDFRDQDNQLWMIVPVR